MSKYILYAHLASISVKKGDVLNGKRNVGVIGSSGNTAGAHLHFQLETELPSGYPAIRGFDQFSDPSNPSSLYDTYGKPSSNDVTQSYWNYSTVNYSGLHGGHHTGIDYSGVIDKSYESKYCWSLPNAKCKVIATGSDPLVSGKWSGYGNYVILEILGKKEDITVTTTFMNEKFKCTGYYNVLMELGSGGAMVWKDANCTKSTGNTLRDVMGTKYLPSRFIKTIKKNGKTWYVYEFMNSGGNKRYYAQRTVS